jgi:hypothetical protein
MVSKKKVNYGCTENIFNFFIALKKKINETYLMPEKFMKIAKF